MAPLSCSNVDSSTDVTIEWALTRAEANAESMRASYLQISNPEKKEMALSDLQTAVSEGYHGAASDAVLEASTDWGFDLSGARSVFLWHGDNDKDVPMRAGEYLSEKTGGVLKAVEGENHTLIRRRWVEILRTVIVGVGSETNKL